MLIYSTFDQLQLDREYSPSSCIDDIDVFLDEYARASRSIKESATKEGSCICNLAYGGPEDERLDLFLPPSAISHSAISGAMPPPLQLYIHGGYWQALSKEDSLFPAAMFQQQGSFFAALDYTLAPAASMSHIVEQVRRAIAFLYKHADQWGFDRHGIHLSGSSAGAHLASMMLCTDWLQYGLPENVIKGICAVSGIYDLEPIRLSYVNEPLGMDQRESAGNSPLGQAILNDCPIILAFGDNETGEFKRQTAIYRDFLLSEACQVKFSEIRDRNHFNVIMDLMNPDTWLSRQVLRQMRLI